MIGTDVIVLGSGFGGAVLSCRLSEAGYRVLVLAPFVSPLTVSR
jgi:phytoene dehydrogenase-like protein